MGLWGIIQTILSILMVGLMISGCTIPIVPCSRFIPSGEGGLDFSAARPEQKTRYYRCRADKRDEEAQYQLALAYEQGNGIEQSYDRAVWWYGKAGNNKSGYKWKNEIAIRVSPPSKGHADAQYRLGLLYLKGLGRDQNDNYAKIWFTRAAEQGHPAAIDILKNSSFQEGAE